jgi:hypothetical protein
VVPFAIFLALTFCQSSFGESARYWFYFGKAVAGAWLIWLVWPAIPEMRWNVSWEAIAVGVGVFVLWVGLDGLYPTLDQLTQNQLCPLLRKVGLESWCPKPSSPAPWNPPVFFGPGSVLGVSFVLVRIVGSSLVVPPLEEVFFRSFLYRYIAKADFQLVPLGQFMFVPFLVTSVLFGFEHHEWLAGILCGFAYQGLVCWKKRLGDAIAAHALTNFLLGVWVVWRGAWQFW